MTVVLKKTALTDIHKEKSAKMVPFAGYEMPIWYTSISHEHKSVREASGIFDVSHMGLIILAGKGASEFLQTITCNDVDAAKAGKMVYSMILNHDGGILDDIMFGYSNNHFVVIVNANNAEKIIQWMSSQKPDDVVLQYLNQTHGLLAIQGPDARNKLSQILRMELQEIKRFSIQEVEHSGAQLYLMRTGYTGEDGFEILAPYSSIKTIWQTAMQHGVKPCGLGARDTLRIEAALPLYGQELSESINPLMTRYRWVVKWDKPFIGKQALEAYKLASDKWTTVGIEMLDRMIPRSGYKIKEGGEVTSGTLSPSLEKAIAMAKVKKEYSEPGTKLHVNIRGKYYTGIVVSLPFF
jgi:aminomethyltransferase